MRRPFVAGNWKMNTDRVSGVSLAKEIATEIGANSAVEVAVAPPFVYLPAISEAIAGSGVELAAQNAHFESQGAFTGEVAPGMLADVGCDYVILGHSERRQIFGETDELINKKLAAAIQQGLKVILCLGETLEERDGNLTESVLERQLSGGLAGRSAEELKDLVIAYEPVWAIGTGRNATPEQAQSAHAFIRGWLSNQIGAGIGESTRIQYGGSVKPENAAELLSQADVDGALVGGASLKAESFLAIIRAAGVTG